MSDDLAALNAAAALAKRIVARQESETAKTGRTINAVEALALLQEEAAADARASGRATPDESLCRFVRTAEAMFRECSPQARASSIARRISALDAMTTTGLLSAESLKLAAETSARWQRLARLPEGQQSEERTTVAVTLRTDHAPDAARRLG